MTCVDFKGKEETGVEDLFCNNTLYHAIEIKLNLKKKKRAPLGGTNINKNKTGMDRFQDCCKA